MHEVQHETRYDAELRSAVAYPPAPWRARGQFWAGLFRADLPATLPDGLAPLVDRRWRALALVRYQHGSTLVYDELTVGPLVRVGLRPGLFVERMYVDSVPALEGGREIWGLPKTLATFAWQGDVCSVTDESGIIARLRLDRRSGAPLPLPAALGGIGSDDEHWRYLAAPGWFWLRLGGVELLEWSGRDGYLLPSRPAFALTIARMRVRFPAPVLIPRALH